MASVAALSLTGCAHCDCTKDNERDGRGRQDIRAEQENGQQDQIDNANTRVSGNGASERQSDGYMDRNTSGSARTTISGANGVGNANTERGVNTFDNDGAPPAGTTTTTTTQPRKPGTTGSYRTRAAGTGTQSGRQVN